LTALQSRAEPAPDLKRRPSSRPPRHRDRSAYPSRVSSVSVLCQPRAMHIPMKPTLPRRRLQPLVASGHAMLRWRWSSRRTGRTTRRRLDAVCRPTSVGTRRRATRAAVSSALPLSDIASDLLSRLRRERYTLKTAANRLLVHEGADLQRKRGFKWRRWESNPRPQSRKSGLYERSRRSDLISCSPRRRGYRGPASLSFPGLAEADRAG
jgi:hypothetical protein